MTQTRWVHFECEIGVPYEVDGAFMRASIDAEKLAAAAREALRVSVGRYETLHYIDGISLTVRHEPVPTVAAYVAARWRQWRARRKVVLA